MAITKARAKESRMAIALRLRERKAQEKDSNRADYLEHSSTSAEPQQLPIEINNASLGDQQATNPDVLSQIKSKDCNPQARSNIFKIPAELRQQIYKHVFVQYESRAHAYAPDALYYRPGCTGPKRINTALLYTCRRILLEARFIPLRTATHGFWGQVHSPEQHTEPSEMIPSHRSARGLTEAHLPYMRRFHFYGSQYNFSNSTRLHMTLLSLPDYPLRCQPRHVTITVPYEGWPHWEYGWEPELLLDDEGMFQLNWPASLETLCIRLETLEVFAPELEKIMGWMMGRKITRRSGDEDSQYLTANMPMRASRWTGPHLQYFKDRWDPNVEHLGPDPMDVSELWYYVVEATWSLDI